MKIKGKIIKLVAGFYYVEADNVIYTCKARGKFRKTLEKPVVGDECLIDITQDTGYIISLEKRKNDLYRPPIANIDQAVLVFSVTEPQFDSLLLDRFLAIIEHKNITPIIVITKTDLSSTLIEKIKEDYQNYKVIFTSIKTKTGIEEIKNLLEGKVTVFTGQSGVGKSSLLNEILPDLNLETNEISKALGRGKHTTRTVELIKINNGYVADTPGFSSLDYVLEPTELATSYHDFKELSKYCKFRGCLHDKEPDCAVKDEVGHIISKERYEHYLVFLEEMKQKKEKKYG